MTYLQRIGAQNSVQAQAGTGSDITTHLAGLEGCRGEDGLNCVLVQLLEGRERRRRRSWSVMCFEEVIRLFGVSIIKYRRHTIRV